MGILRFSVNKAKLSSLTSVFKGASLSFQSGMSSFNARGSKHAPDNVWAPKENKLKSYKQAQQKIKHNVSKIKSSTPCTSEILNYIL